MKRKSFKKMFAEAQKRESYWVAESILDFTENIYRLMEQKKISKADLAKALQVSPAYVTKILGEMLTLPWKPWSVWQELLAGGSIPMWTPKMPRLIQQLARQRNFISQAR